MKSMPAITREPYATEQSRQSFILLCMKARGYTFDLSSSRCRPDRGNWQRDLPVSYGKLGSTFRLAGEKVKARDALRQDRSITERLTKMSPSNVVWKRDLRQFDKLIGELANPQGSADAPDPNRSAGLGFGQ
jgi:hypothetical protein